MDKRCVGRCLTEEDQRWVVKKFDGKRNAFYFSAAQTLVRRPSNSRVSSVEEIQGRQHFVHAPFTFLKRDNKPTTSPPSPRRMRDLRHQAS